MKIVKYQSPGTNIAVPEILTGFSGELHISADRVEESTWPHYSPLLAFSRVGLHSLTPDSLAVWFEDPLRIKFIELYQQKHNLPQTFVLLDAHGDEKKGQWVYWDGKRYKNLQGWVKHHDGNTALIIISSCNPDRKIVYAGRSLLLIASTSVGYIDSHIIAGERSGINSWNLYQPFGREVDDYEIEYSIFQLEQRQL